MLTNLLTLYFNLMFTFYPNINPNNMKAQDIKNICTELQTAKDWGVQSITVETNCTRTGQRINKDIEVKTLPQYQAKLRSELCF